MVPTLVGERATAHCGTCLISSQVDVSARRLPPPKVICSHCGQPLDLDAAEQPRRSLAADVVSIRHIAATDLARGDLVAIQWDDQLHVKRLVGLPGDMIDVDENHLLLGDKRVEDRLMEDAVQLPHFLVDLDPRRAESRWAPMGIDSEWNRTLDEGWSLSAADDPTWLVYHHRNVHRGNRPSPVLDDYPFNVGLARKLFPVDRLLVRGCLLGESPAVVDVAFWTKTGPRLVEAFRVDGKEFAVSYYDSTRIDSARRDLPVRAEQPVAIRVHGGPSRLSELSVRRLIEYRLRPHDDRHQYPLQVAPDHCFVLGDNVPVSVDSRDVGLVPIAQIVGVVTAVRKAARK